MRIQIVLFDGVDPLDVIAPYEVLYAGGMFSEAAVSVELVSAEGARDVVSGTGGLPLRATAALDPARADLVLVPGAAGRLGGPDEVSEQDGDAEEGQQDASIPELLGRTLTTELPTLLKTAMNDPEVTVATVCGGSLILGLAGLLEGRHATTHHLGMDTLEATGVHAVRARVVDDGDLVSGAGVTSGLDLALYLLEREVGPRIAHAVEELFAYERRGTVWRPQGPAPVDV
ncbi:DJ-1/PfpI family protein [Streptomyces smyrnaeus]|uniref:DJ-1/PfpI family protein n=1 Tax=Streptomyces smyrnaeus TaxID=1387713 RepID=UPI0033BD6844